MPIIDINKFKNQIVFFGFCPGADFTRRLDTRWKELGICEFQYFESKVQVKRFASIEVGDLIVLKKRQIIGKTMRVYGYGLVTGITKDDKGNRVLKVDWSSQEQVIEVPLLGCNATIDIRDIDKVRAEMPDAFFEWLNQGAGISNLPKPASKTEAAVLEDSEIDEDSSEQELIDAAYWDDVEAMEYLGSGYANGKWGEEDSANSFKWYMKAAEHGSEMGMFNAASYLVQGDVVEQNMELALLFLNKLAVGSDYSADANHNLGVIYENGIGNIPKDVTKAKEYYLKAKNLGSNEAAEALQSLTEDKVSVQDADDEYNNLLKAAEAGDDQAQVQLSMYCNGRAESNNDSEAENQKWAERAVDWMTKAAAQKNIFALKSMADLFRQVGDYKNSISYLETAAKLNDAIAICNLGVHYEEGLGCSQDLEKSFELTKKAADLGMPKAMRIVGYKYDVGEGVEKNEKIAFAWYHKAAEAGDARAQLNLADMYAAAAGTEQNIEQAQYWALKAIENPDSSEPDIPEQARSFLNDIEKIIKKQNKSNTESNNSNRSSADHADNVLNAKSKAIKIFNKIECEYEYIGDFKNGIAEVRKNGLWGLLAKDGTLIVQPEHRFENDTLDNETFWDEIKIEWSGFQGFDIAPFCENKKLSFVNKKGQVVRRTEFLYDNKNEKIWLNSLAHHSNDSSLLAFTAEGKIGFISNDGKIAIPPKYTYVEEEDGTLYGFGCGLARVNQNGLWGFINKADEFVIEPKFTNIGYFYDNPGEPIKVQIDGKMGFIDVKGNVVISADYEWDEFGGVFVDGQCYVKNNSTKVTQVINTDGKILINPPAPITYLNDQRYRESNFVFAYNGKYGLINSDNEVIAPAHYDWIGKNIKHLNLICIKHGNKYGLIDGNGNRVLNPISDEEICFKTTEDKLTFYSVINIKSEDQSLVIDSLGNNLLSIDFGCKLYEVIDNFVIINNKDDQYDVYQIIDNTLEYFDTYLSFYPLYEDYFITKKDELYGICDNSCKEILPHKFSCIDQIGETGTPYELVMLADEDGLFNSLFDIKKRDILISFEFKSTTNFSGIEDDLFMIPFSSYQETDDGVQEKYGVVYRNGDIILQPVYEDISEFSYRSGLAAFKHLTKIGFINTFGNVKIEPCFDDESSSFTDYIGIVKDSNGWFIIDINGNELTKHRFSNLRVVARHDIFIAGLDEKHGVIDAFGNWLIKPIYDDIYDNSRDDDDLFLKFELNGLFGILTNFNNNLTPSKNIKVNSVILKHAKKFKIILPRKFMFDLKTYENPWVKDRNVTDIPMWRSGYLIVSADSEEAVISEFKKMKKYVNHGIDGVVIESSVDMTVEKIYFYDLQPYSNGSDYYFDFEVSDMPEDYRIAYERGQELGSGTRYLFESWKVISHLSIYTGDIDDIECIELRSAS